MYLVLQGTADLRPHQEDDCQAGFETYLVRGNSHTWFEVTLRNDDKDDE